MGSKKQTIGYRYFFSLHMGLGRGPMQLLEIKVGDRTAWTGALNHGQSSINKPDLFGGEKKEGGIDGDFYFLSGKPDQTLPPASGRLPSIEAQLGGLVPAFRGVSTIWYDGLIAAMNPYPKEWKFKVKRTTEGWYQNNIFQPADIQPVAGIAAMNGAHILYECATNPDWGRGMPPELVDEVSFGAAAVKLFGEQMGLCIPWFRQEPMEQFVQKVIDHIAAVQYVSRETGKLTLKLIRADYDIETLPTFTPSTGLMEITDDDTSADENGFNEIIVVGRNPQTDEDISVRVQNLASIQTQGAIISNTINYPGLPTENLCFRAAMRELRGQTNVRKLSVKLDRRGWKLTPGQPFRVIHEGRDVDVVLRAGEITHSGSKSGDIDVQCLVDRFGQPDETYSAPQPSGWTPPNFEALPALEERLLELGYRDILLLAGEADTAELTATSAVIGLLAAKASQTQLGYDLATRADGESFETFVEEGQYVGFARLKSNTSPLSNTFLLDNYETFPDLEDFVGEAAMINNEIVQITAFNPVSGAMTVNRGVADTIPKTHVIDDYLWLIDDDVSSDGREYSQGETVFAKVLSRTSTEVLGVADAAELSQTLIGRQARPYPPGDVRLQAESVLTVAGGLTASYPYAVPIVNPGGETGDTTGWTQTVGGGFVVNPGGRDSDFYFHASTNSGTSEFQQDVPIGPGYWEDIDLGAVQLNASAWLNSFSGDSDNGQLFVSALDGDDNILETVNTEPSSVNVWTKQSLFLQLPVLTRKIRYRTRNIRTGGVQNSVYWDDFYGELEPFGAPKTVIEEPFIEWKHRDRLTQADQLVAHPDGSIGPEPGVTYTIRVYDTDTDALLSTHAEIAGESWTYTTALQTADGAPQEVTMELVSVRDGIESWQRYRFDVLLNGGWGYGWGLNWGGATA